MNNPKIYLVTGVNNGWKHTKLMLDCAVSQEYKNIEIIVVDDGSTDGTGENIKKHYPKVKIIKGNGDLWWTGCMFEAIRMVLLKATDDDYVLTVNNDCTFETDYLCKILSVAKDNHNCVIGSIFLDSTDRETIVDSGAKIEWIRGRVYRPGYNKISEIPKNIKFDKDIDTLSTRGTLFPVSIIKKVGNFDKMHFPHYVSDFEYACRIKKSGYGLIVAFNCVVYNDKNRTGFSGPNYESINFDQLKKMLFGRKSQINIVDHFYFIYLCCPWYLQPLNYIYLVAKLIYLTSFLGPFYHFRWPLVWFRKKLLSI